MEKKDFSKEILDNYYDSKDKLLRIILNDDTVLDGILVGFFRSAEDSHNPYIFQWHFVDKKDVKEYRENPANEEFGTIIRQEDIKVVRFL